MSDNNKPCQHAWHKYGRTSAGIQRYRCPHCGATSQDVSPTTRGRSRRYEKSEDLLQANRRESYSYRFERLHSYSSHPELRVEQEQAIKDSCYDHFPAFAFVNGISICLDSNEWTREPDEVKQLGYSVFREKTFTEIGDTREAQSLQS